MQQINLFARIPVIKEKKHGLTKQHMIVILIGLWGFFIVYAAYDFFHANRLKREVGALLIEQKRTEGMLEELVRKYPEETKRSLEAKSQEIEQEIASKQELLNILTRASGSKGFSARLDALAKTIVANVWLDNIVFEKSSAFVGMTGKGLNSEGIFRFVDNLADNPQFRAVKFQTFTLSGTESDNVVSFVLTNELGRVPEAKLAEEEAKKKD